MLALVCVPTPCFCTYTEAKVGTRKGGFPERWTAELGSGKKPEHRLKSQGPKGFSIPHLCWSPGLVQILTQSLNLRKELSSAWPGLCLAHPCPPSQGFQQEHRLLGQVSHEVEVHQGRFPSQHALGCHQNTFLHAFKGLKNNPTRGRAQLRRHTLHV